MSKHVLFRCTLVVAVSLSCAGGVAFGWAPIGTHPALCQKTFDDPVLQPFLGTINQSAIENYSFEPDGHNVQWSSMTNRSYIDTAAPISGFDWNAMDETTRLQTLMHHTGDVGVPLDHMPAGTIYTNDQVAEGFLEAQVATWGTYPTVAGTTSYTHNRNGHSYNFTGTIDQVVNTFYSACRDNASWFKSTPKPWYLFGSHLPADNTDAGWNGTTIALMLQRAVFVDYFLAKLPTVADLDDARFVLSPGGSARFDGRGCYDPDAVSWNSNGTYTQTYATLAEYCWDFNDDGVWDQIDHDPYVDRTYEQLVAIGVPVNTWVNYQLRVKDNEGKYAFEEDWLWLNSGGVPEPATMSLLIVGGVAMLRRKR